MLRCTCRGKGNNLKSRHYDLKEEQGDMIYIIQIITEHSNKHIPVRFDANILRMAI